jgi:hypothetical protein
VNAGNPPGDGHDGGWPAMAGQRGPLSLEPSQPPPSPFLPDGPGGVTRDESITLTGPVPQASGPDDGLGAAADARVVPVEWGLWGKEPNVPGYRIMRCSNGALGAADFHRFVSRYSSGVKETLPQYTVGWIPGRSGGTEYLVVAIHELADQDPARAGGRVRASRDREIEYIRLFCARYTDLAQYRATYYELVDAVKDTQLPAELTEPLRVGLPEFDPPHFHAAVRGYAESVAALLLTTRPVYILGSDGSDAFDAFARLRFIDYVLSLLPYGLRATFSASTWASATARDLKLRLFFTNARRAPEDGICLHWGQPAAPELLAADLSARHYASWLEHGGSNALAELAEQADPVRFTADDVRKAVDGAPHDRPVEDVIEALADGLRRQDQPAVTAAVKRLRTQYRNKPPDAAGRLWYRQEVDRRGLLRPHAGLNAGTIASVYRVLLDLAFQNPLSYSGYCDLVDYAGGPPTGALRREVLKRSFEGYVPWLLVLSTEDEYSELKLREILLEQGIAPTAPLREVQVVIGRVRREHRAAVYDFAVNYLRVTAPDSRAVLRRLGYITTTVEAAFPGDLKEQRIRLESTLRFVYDGLLSDEQAQEIYAQPGLNVTPAFKAAVERLRRPPEQVPAPPGRPKKRRPESRQAGEPAGSRLSGLRNREWHVSVRASEVVLGLLVIVAVVIIVIVLSVLHLT